MTVQALCTLCTHTCDVRPVCALMMCGFRWRAHWMQLCAWLCALIDLQFCVCPYEWMDLNRWLDSNHEFICVCKPFAMKPTNYLCAQLCARTTMYENLLLAQSASRCFRVHPCNLCAFVCTLAIVCKSFAQCMSVCISEHVHAPLLFRTRPFYYLWSCTTIDAIIVSREFRRNYSCTCKYLMSTTAIASQLQVNRYYCKTLPDTDYLSTFEYYWSHATYQYWVLLVTGYLSQIANEYCLLCK